jgi:hypothetical protein
LHACFRKEGKEAGIDQNRAGFGGGNQVLYVRRPDGVGNNDEYRAGLERSIQGKHRFPAVAGTYQHAVSAPDAKTDQTAGYTIGHSIQFGITHPLSFADERRFLRKTLAAVLEKMLQEH